MNVERPRHRSESKRAAGAAGPRTYAQSLVIRLCLPILFLAMLTATVGAIVLAVVGGDPAYADQHYVPMAAMLFAVLSLWLLLVSLSVNRRIRLDERGITQLGLLGRRYIGWGDVKELCLGGNRTFAEGGLGTKLFIEGRDGTLISFTSRLHRAVELVERVEARTGLTFEPAEGTQLIHMSSDADDRPGKPDEPPQRPQS
jgi:hypothetical protein